MLSFDLLKDAWKRFLARRQDDIRASEPNFTSPENVYLKLVGEDNMSLNVQFLGFENAVEQSRYIPQAKHVILNWLKQISMNVQVQRGIDNTLIAKISKEMKFDESRKFTKPELPAVKIASPNPADSKYDRIVEHGLTNIVIVEEI